MTEVIELQGFTPAEAEHLISRRICAQCWSNLVIQQEDGKWMRNVICPSCGESVEITGHISTNTPGIIMENAKFAYKEVRRNLRDIFPYENSCGTLSVDQCLKDLGF